MTNSVKKRWKTIIISFLSVIAIVFVFMYVNKIKNVSNVPSNLNIPEKPVFGVEFPEGEELESLRQTEIEKLKEEPSDIKGMTKYDKYEMGLLTKDSSDSDLDGLTDKEEIENYGSDPLKFSTSGDLYSDKQKIEKGWDVNKYYEYEGDYEYPNSTCPEIIFEPSSAINLNAIAYDYTKVSAFHIDDVETIRSYYILLHEGHLSIDISKVSKDLSVKDICVYIQTFYEIEAHKTDFSSEGNIITLSDKMDATTPYIIYLVKKDSVDTVLGVCGSTFKVSHGRYETKTYEQTEENKYDPGILYVKIGSGVTCYYAEDTYENQTIQSNVKSLSKALKTKEVTFEKVSKDTLLDKYERLNNNLGLLHFDLSKIDTQSKDYSVFSTIWYVATWFDYSDLCNATGETRNIVKDGTSKDGVKLRKKFDILKDSFIFPNMSLKLSDDWYSAGCCMGYSLITAKVFNDNGLSPLTNKTTKKTDRTDMKDLTRCTNYDLNKDKENKTFSNQGLRDYTKGELVKYKGGLLSESDVKEFETEALHTIACFQDYGNDNIPYTFEDIKDWDSFNKKGSLEQRIYSNFTDGSVVKNLAKYIDSGKIAIACIPLYNEGTNDFYGNHAINVVAYEINSENATDDVYEKGDVYTFYCYDSNNPYQYGTLVLQENKIGEVDFTSFLYTAPDNCKYWSGSEVARHHLIVMDDDCNSLYD